MPINFRFDQFSPTHHVRIHCALLNIIYVYTYICVYTYTRVFICVYMYICIFVYIYILNIPMYIVVYTHTYMIWPGRAKRGTCHPQPGDGAGGYGHVLRGVRDIRILFIRINLYILYNIP